MKKMSDFKVIDAFDVEISDNNENEKFFNGVKPMNRLKVKSKLLADVNLNLTEISKINKVYSILGYYAKKIKKLALRQIYRDYKKGVKVVNNKIPVYIELPKLKEEGNGAYSEIKVTDVPDKPKEVIIENVDMIKSVEEKKLLK